MSDYAKLAGVNLRIHGAAQTFSVRALSVEQEQMLRDIRDGALVVCPAEPTEVMVSAGCSATCRECHADCDQGPTAEIYRAMLAASQEKP